MPKIIENLQERLKEEALRQVRENGYEAMTIRSVAKSVGIGIGTMYNYYPSKEALVASFMLEGWLDAMERVAKVSEASETLEPVLRSIYDEISSFMKSYSAIFSNDEAQISFHQSTQNYHYLLRTQVSESVRKFTSDQFTSDFIAEAMVTWTVEGQSYNTLSAAILRLI